ncbi:10894_t:CDS:2, partial [Cetraspora pellucida]
MKRPHLYQVLVEGTTETSVLGCGGFTLTESITGVITKVATRIVISDATEASGLRSMNLYLSFILSSNLLDHHSTGLCLGIVEYEWTGCSGWDRFNFDFGFGS